MLAVIMAGGYGKRLKPLTDRIPKTLVRVGGKPIIYWQIKWLEACGVERFVLLGGFKAGMIRKYIESIGYSDRFKFSVERKPLGTGGAIANAKGLLKNDKEFLLVNGDNITDLDTRRLRLASGDAACIAIVPYRSSKGIVRVNGSRITKFEEKPMIQGYWFNGGVMLLDSRILDAMPRKGSLEAEVLPRLARSGKLSYVKFSNSYFNSVDSIKDMEDVDRDLRSGKVRFR